MSTFKSIKPVFMYIPDMTGFTEYMASKSVDDSHHIIEKMLNLIADCNQLDMVISDIMGDAIFFFKVCEEPLSISQIMRQTLTIQTAFQKEISGFGQQFNWKKNSYDAVHDLGIKFIAHYGEASVVTIKHHKKLIGNPVIETHKLLKNSVEEKNYLLLSEACIEACKQDVDMLNWQSSSDSYEHIGSIDYRVINLDQPI